MSEAFRVAAPAEAAEVAALVNRAYRVEDFFKVGDRTDEAEVAALLQEHKFLVAEQGGRMTGCVLVEVNGQRGYFGMLSVDPAVQGCGLGRRLVDAAEQYCLERGCREMDLWVVNLREELPPWYERLGYRVVGTEPWPEEALKELSRPAHFLVMSKTLLPRAEARARRIGHMAESIALTTPLTDEVIDGLSIGQHVTFSGVIYTARDAAHKRLIEMKSRGEELPVDLRGQVIYYVGPTPPRPGAVIGSAGPTTSMRLDPYTRPMLEMGLKGIIGKGGRGPDVRKAIQEHHALYCIAVGGTGALLNRHIKSAEVVAFEDLGTEAIRRLEVEGFPAIVVNDCRGGDLLEAGKAEYRTSARPIPAVKALGG